MDEGSGRCCAYYEAALRLSTPQLQETHPRSATLPSSRPTSFCVMGIPARRLRSRASGCAGCCLHNSEYRQLWMKTAASTCVAARLRWRKIGTSSLRRDRSRPIWYRSRNPAAIARNCGVNFVDSLPAERTGTGQGRRLAQSGMLSAAHQVLSGLEKQGHPTSGWLMLAENWASRAAERSRERAAKCGQTIPGRT